MVCRTYIEGEGRKRTPELSDISLIQADSHYYQTGTRDRPTCSLEEVFEGKSYTLTLVRLV